MAAVQEIAAEPPPDPDVQATVTDFIDYTDVFPSDLFRSLSLIEKLDEDYLKATDTVHTLTTLYAQLPTGGSKDKIDARELRGDISNALEKASRCREAAAAEASRLNDVASRYHTRLLTIEKKLHALPKPPSRDPTPAAVTSPQASRRPRSDGNARYSARADERQMEKKIHLTTSARRVTVPGEVLPPPDPNSPPLLTASDWESSPEAASPPPEPKIRLIPGGRKNGKLAPPSESIKPEKMAKIPKSQKPRPSGIEGTNVHSAIAGISTSNALAKLSPPPSDARPGSRHLPWNKLTEYEMARLRKRMKKNAIWLPSATMVRRELSDLGRGEENMNAAKEHAQATGEGFVDEDPYNPNAPPRPGEVIFGGSDTGKQNRGMLLNEAKKLKRALMLSQQEGLARSASPDMASARKYKRGIDMSSSPDVLTGKIHKRKLTLTRRDMQGGQKFPSTPRHQDSVSLDMSPDLQAAQQQLADLSNKWKRAMEQAGETPAGNNAKSTTLKLSRSKDKALDSGVPSSRKRERPTSSVSQQRMSYPVVETPAPKRLKINAPAALHSTAGSTTTKIPLAPAAPSPKKSAIHASRASPEKRTKDAKNALTQSRPRRNSLSLLSDPALLNSASSRSRSTRGSKAQSAEPATASRRSSNASVAVVKSAQGNRGRRRPAPGTVAKDEDGETNVAVSKRRGKVPKKDEKGDVTDPGWEDIDPDEPTYCICDRVSFGEMVACENLECEKEWFHLECVGLDKAPGRRTKWWCPLCRKSMAIDQWGKPLPSAPKRNRNASVA